MFDALLNYGDVGLLVLRLVVAAVFMYHGMPKLKNAAMMAHGMGMSAGMVKGLGLVEVLSGIALVIGVQVQLAALLLALVMLGAIYYKTQKWSVAFAPSDKTGWEFDLTLLAANIVLLTSGGGTIGLGI